MINRYLNGVDYHARVAKSQDEFNLGFEPLDISDANSIYTYRDGRFTCNIKADYNCK